jgi:hypothetical protein
MYTTHTIDLRAPQMRATTHLIKPPIGITLVRRTPSSYIRCIAVLLIHNQRVAKLYDADGNGTLDLDEFRTMLVNLDDLDPSNVAQFWVDALKVRAERSKEERREKERQRERDESRRVDEGKLS